MRLHYLGHAGWMFEENGTTLVCDPWQGAHGAFYASWFPFPANDHVVFPADASAIYISHAHEDHFDPESLRDFPRTTKIVIANFRDPVLVEGLRALGFLDIQMLEDGVETSIGCFSVRILRDEDSGMYHDSAILVRSATATALNLNDCRLLEPSRWRQDHIDILLAQFSGANWYPCVYDYANSYGKQLSSAKRLRGLERLARAAAQTGARITVPCAGPPAFLDSTLFHYNDITNSDDNPFPMMDTAVKFLRDRGHPAILCMPGDIIDASDGTLQSRIISPKEVYDGRETYLRSYARKKRPLISDFLSRLPAEPRTGALFKSELARILRSSHKFIGLIQGLVQFQLLGVENGDIVLDCRPGVPPDVRDYGGEAVNYRFTLDHRYVHHILQSRFINFESVLLSMRFKAWRNPDIFNEALFSLLVNFDRQRLQQAEHELQSVLDANDEFFEVVHDGEYYRVQRYCPHMGSDLSAVGQFGGGTITCMRHGWQFRLSDGACLNVAVPPLRVRRLENRSSHCS